MGEEAVGVVNLHVGHLEGHHLVGLGAEQQELVLLVPGLLALLVAAHETVPRLGVLLHLRVLHLDPALFLEVQGSGFRVWGLGFRLWQLQAQALRQWAHCGAWYP